jgi:DNA-binding MarR family transcriptional regulator
VVKLALTDEGKAVYPQLIASAAEVTNRSLEGFTKSEAQQFESLLQRMLDSQ